MSQMPRAATYSIIFFTYIKISKLLNGMINPGGDS